MVTAIFGAFLAFEKIKLVVVIPSKEVCRYISVASALLETSEEHNKQEFPPTTNRGIFNVGLVLHVPDNLFPL